MGNHRVNPSTNASIVLPHFCSKNLFQKECEQMNKIIYMLIVLAVGFQIAGLILVFSHLVWGLICFGLQAVMILLIIAILIKIRWDEKKEDDRNDFSDY